MAREIAMFKWCGVPIIVKSVPLRSVGTGKCSSAVPMIVARSRAERGNIEWLEKLQCSSGVPIIVKSVPLCSVGTGKCSSACTNECGTEWSGAGIY
jgi:hypothetical protein